jgi:hypothetical protein
MSARANPGGSQIWCDRRAPPRWKPAAADAARNRIVERSPGTAAAGSQAAKMAIQRGGKVRRARDRAPAIHAGLLAFDVRARRSRSLPPRRIRDRAAIVASPSHAPSHRFDADRRRCHS